MYERILFEIDGTLLDSEHVVRKALARLLKEKQGLDLSPGSIPFYYGIPGVDSLRLLKFPDPERGVELWNKYIREDYAEVSLFPGIRETLTQLKNRGFILGIVTSKTKEEYRHEFQHLYGLDDFFEDVVCFDDTIEHKPNPAPILEYLHRNRGNPSQTVYIGHTVHDFNCADQAGVNFVLALWGCSSAGVIQARYQPATPQELPGLPLFT